MKRSVINVVGIATAALFLSACGTTNVKPTQEVAPPAPPAPPPKVLVPQEAVLANVPAWFLATQAVDGDWLLVVGTGVSRDLNMALKKAKLEAQSQLAGRIATEIDSITKSYKKDAGPDVEFVESTEAFVRKLVEEVKISGGQVTNKVVVPEGRAYRAYVQIRYPIANAVSKVAKMGPAVLEEELNARRASRNQGVNVKIENTGSGNVSKTSEPRVVVNNTVGGGSVSDPGATVTPIDDSGIVVRGTRATETSGPLNLSGDELEEN